MNQTLADYFGLPAGLFGGVTLTPDGVSRDASDLPHSGQFDVLKNIPSDGTQSELPSDFTKIIDDLRLEHYRRNIASRNEMFAASEPARRLYYFIREVLPVSVRRHLQRAYFRNWDNLPFPSWPVDFTVDILHEDFLRLLMKASGISRVPFIWFWPDGAPNCLIMTHDVETSEGSRSTSQLMDLDDSYGFKASFQVIPENRYAVSNEYVHEIRSRGCEFNIHDLTHDGRLFQERAEFLRRAVKINAYVRQYGARGFRAGAMYRNQDWYDAFEFSYDMSVPNVAHLEPMRGGCCTVMRLFCR